MRICLCRHLKFLNSRSFKYETIYLNIKISKFKIWKSQCIEHSRCNINFLRGWEFFCSLRVTFVCIFLLACCVISHVFFVLINIFFYEVSGLWSIIMKHILLLGSHVLSSSLILCYKRIQVPLLRGLGRPM